MGCACRWVRWSVRTVRAGERLTIFLTEWSMLSLKELPGSSKEGQNSPRPFTGADYSARCALLDAEISCKSEDEFTPKTLTCLFQSAHTGHAFMTNVARYKSPPIPARIGGLCAFMRPQCNEAYDISAPFFVGLHMASAG
jgi:hypothetical protein